MPDHTAANSPPARLISVVAYPGAEILDIAGPLEVFAFASLALQRQGRRNDPGYRIEVLAAEPGPVQTLSGMQIIADRAYTDAGEGIDTLLVPGSGDVQRALRDQTLLAWIRNVAARVRRVGSVCTGAFLLAGCGLLHKRRATTHWHYCKQLAEQYPAVTVLPDKLFVRDGCVYSSGGICSGIDLALALVEEDWGRELALFVARYLVMFLNRPGGQAQFSVDFSAETASRTDLRGVQSWISQHLTNDLRVARLAGRLAMSPRNFARLFVAETGITPAKFVEQTRLDAARRFLEDTDLPVAVVAEKTGFYDAERMRRSFIRQLGVNPQNYRARFSRSNVGMNGEN